MHTQKPVIYSSESVFRHPLHFLRRITDDLARSHDIGWRLAVRDLKGQYRQAALGFLWALILPLGNAAAWLLMRNAGIINAGEVGIPYALYAFIGTMLWGIFAEALTAPVSQAAAAKPLLAKVNFPPEALVISGLYQVGVGALIKLALIVVAVLLFGFNPGIQVFLLLAGVLALMLAGTALGLLLTPLGLLYGDVGKSLPLLVQFGMYLSPVVYAAPKAGWMRQLMDINPASPLISTTRDWAVGNGAVSLHFLAVVAASLVLVVVMWAIYKAAMPILVERMNG